MRYQKPAVIHLSAAAHAAGQDPLGCYAGDNPSGAPGICGTGNLGFPACNPGASAFFTQVCAGGAATSELCTSGAIANAMDNCMPGGSDLPAP